MPPIDSPDPIVFPGQTIARLSDYVALTKAIQAGDMMGALKRYGLDMGAYAQVAQAWAMKMATEPGLTARFASMMSGQIAHSAPVGQKAPPASAAREIDLLPGRVAARIYAHELRTANSVVPCWSYVTHGLRTMGQREIVLTLARPAGAGPDSVAVEPLKFLETLADYAARGQIVDAGGLTELGPEGLFDRPWLRGFAYEKAVPMDGVPLPSECLVAVALVAHELDTVKRFGALRVLARLGRATGFFPTMPWCDVDRGPVSPPESGTCLENVASIHLPGASVVLQNDRVVVRASRASIPLLAQALPSLPPNAALAFLTPLDSRADACLVWTPGQKGNKAISPPGSRGARVSGCFALFVPQQEADTADAFEDGFPVMLTAASWARLRAALMKGAPGPFPPSTPDGNSFALEWYDPLPVSG